jgi:hypothetical protein
MTVFAKQLAESEKPAELAQLVLSGMNPIAA